MPYRRSRVLLFDLGETLIYFDDVPLSWQSLYRAALETVAARCGVTPGEADYAAAEAVLCRFNGRLNPRTVEITAADVWGGIGSCLNIFPERHEQAANAFFQFFLGRRLLYEDTLPTVERLKAEGYRLAILTDVPYGMPKSIAARMLEGIETYFDVWITSVEAGYCKPSPNGLLRLAERMGVSPTETAYVGNERKDTEAANAAGMFSIRLNRANSADSFGERRSINSLHELLK